VMLNDAEVRMLTGEPVLKTAAAQLRAHGPRVLVIKQGSYGSCMCTDDGFFFVPGIPLDTVVDPTGAGDAFAGGFFGYLDSHAVDPFDEGCLRRAAVYGSVMASFAIEGFGSERLEQLTHAHVVERCGAFHDMTRFDHVAARERVLVR
jgi:sugar/nucleoside kinase (ribokinase family)